MFFSNVAAWLRSNSRSSTGRSAITPSALPGVGLVEHPVFGRCAVATKSFKAGDVVVAEKPFLKSSVKELPKELKTLSQHGRIDPEIMSQLWAFCIAPLELQRMVLTEFYIPDAKALGGTNMLGRCNHMVELVHKEPLIISKLKPLLGVLETGDERSPAGNKEGAVELEQLKELVLKALLAWDSNSHQVGEDGSSLLLVGSKLTHTCAEPNTWYRGTPGPEVPQDLLGLGCHIASRDIQEGELLTTCYFKAGLMPVPARQKLLRAEFGFTCACERCTTGLDHMRGLPCPQCAAAVRNSKGLLRSIGLATGDEPLPGVVYCDMGKQLAGHPTPWSCTACGVQLPDDERQLFGPNFDIEGFKPAAVAGSIEVGVASVVKVMERSLTRDIPFVTNGLAHVSMVVGPKHWAFHKMLCLHAEQHRADLKACFLQAPFITPDGPEILSKHVAWHLQEIEDDMDKLLAWLDGPNMPTYLASTFTVQQELDATVEALLLIAEEGQVLPAAVMQRAAELAGADVGSRPTRGPLLDFQARAARLAHKLLQRLKVPVLATRGWRIPNLFLKDVESYIPVGHKM
mmetsp:Transcript_14026/g.30355  ORF Transcript_14026/g.30355 Transcript_14026/m.30355 type:complete len:572 (+) Transcript_14026:29-1744(+)